MKAITVWQPWATLLATGQKHNETRSWKTSYRGEILIHAAKTDHSGILLHIPMEELKHFQDAGGKNRTKSGTIPQAGHTISADLRVFPLGTKLRINGVVYTVEDSGSGIRGNKLDIFFNSHSQALQYGKRSADVYIVR